MIHRARTEQEYRDHQSGYRGVCSCGWNGPFRNGRLDGDETSKALAWVDVDRHTERIAYGDEIAPAMRSDRWKR